MPPTTDQQRGQTPPGVCPHPGSVPTRGLSPVVIRTLSWNLPRKEGAVITRLSRDESNARDRALLAAGDLDRLFAYYWEPVLSWIHTYANVRAGEADEIRQQVFERVIREIRAGRTYPLPFGGAVFRIAGWTTQGYVQKAARCGEHEVSVGDDDHEQPTGPDPMREIEQMGEHEDLVQRFDRLPERECTLMGYVYLEDLSLLEAAAKMGISGNNAHQIHHRAKRKLMEMITEDME